MHKKHNSLLHNMELLPFIFETVFFCPECNFNSIKAKVDDSNIGILYCDSSDRNCGNKKLLVTRKALIQDIFL